MPDAENQNKTLQAGTNSFDNHPGIGATDNSTITQLAFPLAALLPQNMAAIRRAMFGLLA